MDKRVRNVVCERTLLALLDVFLESNNIYFFFSEYCNMISATQASDESVGFIHRIFLTIIVSGNDLINCQKIFHRKWIHESCFSDWNWLHLLVEGVEQFEIICCYHHFHSCLQIRHQIELTSDQAHQIRHNCYSWTHNELVPGPAAIVFQWWFIRLVQNEGQDKNHNDFSIIQRWKRKVSSSGLALLR